MYQDPIEVPVCPTFIPQISCHRKKVLANARARSREEIANTPVAPMVPGTLSPHWWYPLPILSDTSKEKGNKTRLQIYNIISLASTRTTGGECGYHRWSGTTSGEYFICSSNKCDAPVVLVRATGGTRTHHGVSSLFNSSIGLDGPLLRQRTGSWFRHGASNNNAVVIFNHT